MMINPQINRFISTLLYPISDISLVLEDPFENFFKAIPAQFIDLNTSRIIQKEKKKIYDSAIEYVMKKYTVDNYDQIYQYLEMWYLSPRNWRNDEKDEIVNQNDLYYVVFRRILQLSKSMISKLDGQIIYKYWQTEVDSKVLGGFAGGNKIHLFRSLMQMLPMDILVAAFALDHRYSDEFLKSFYGNIAITDVSLENILSKGIAENHIHIGVSTNFLSIWEDFMCVEKISSQPHKTKRIHIISPHAPSKIITQFYYLLARCLRMYLIVCTWSKFEKNEEFLSAAKILYPDNLKKLYQKMLAEEKEIADIKHYFYELEYKLSNFITHNTDLKSKWAATSKQPMTEVMFLFEMFRFFYDKHNTDKEIDWLKKCFLNYLRIKHGIFSFMVQDKTISGLDYFQTYYHSVSKNKSININTQDNIISYERLINSQLETPHIRCVEFRMSFFEKKSYFIKQLKCFLSAYRNILHKNYCDYDIKTDHYVPIKPFPRVGIIFHFLKSHQEHPDLCINSGDSNLQAYANIHKKYSSQLENFCNIRNERNYEGIDRYLIGIDVASVENAVPTWVFYDIFENARDSKTEPFQSCEKRKFRSLRFTCHAGEDFRHIMSGLRRVYEVVHYLKFHAGDRIGHGLALGTIVDDWCSIHPNVILPRIEALENYIWAYQMLSKFPSKSKGSDLLYLEKCIHQLTAKIYYDKADILSENISINALLKSYNKLFSGKIYLEKSNCKKDCKEKRECLFLSNMFNKDISDFIVYSYHCHKYATRMNEPIHYQILPQEIAILKDLQDIMQNMISRLGIIVEANPSSNVIISDIDTLHDHPIYQLSQPNCDYKDIMLCVNSDDPAVFQTNTANELGIAYMGMIEHGKSRSQCLQWIDKMRESGMHSTFIYNDDSDEMLLQELNHLISVL